LKTEEPLKKPSWLFLEKISTSRNTIENFDSHSDESNETKSDESIESPNGTTGEPLNPETAENPINENSSSEYPIQVNVDGIKVEVDFKESIFLVSINGTILEFLVNGTQIIQVNNSE